MMSENEAAPVLFSVEASVGMITLNRPDLGNSMNLALMQQLQAAISRCFTDPAIRAVLITGRGKLFSGGGDLQEFNAQDDLAAYLRGMTHALHNSIAMLLRMNKPVIAAVNGTAGGAGFSLACACDLVYAADNAKFTMAYTMAGLSPDGSSTYTLPRLVGTRRALELTLTNRRLSAAEALEWGIVTQVCPGDSVYTEALALAQKLAAGPTLAFGTAKQLIHESLNQTPESQMEAEAAGIMAMAASHDGREGIAAFMGMRKPLFNGS